MRASDEMNGPFDHLAIGLGWFSIALGAAELTMPRRMARLVGAREDESTEKVVRTFGAREIGNGLAILAQPDKSAWLWARVGGDAVDLSTLGRSVADTDEDRRRAAIAAVAVAGVTALDVLAATRTGRRDGRTDASRHFKVEEVATINRSIEDVYRFWHDFKNFPRFMRQIESVEILDSRRSRWRASGPAGIPVEWRAEIVQDRENEWIAWRSIEGSTVEISGSVRFAHAPGARGTEVRVQLQYRPPAGAIGRGLTWLFGKDPAGHVREDLFRFKQLMETGEVPLSDGPSMWRAAQPAVDPEQIRTLAEVHL